MDDQAEEGEDSLLRAEQLRREERYVDLIMGRRQQRLAEGDIMAVTPIKRVINSSVPLIAQRWRGVCEGVIEGDTERVLSLLQTNIFPVIQLQESYQRLFTPILSWFLRGRSPGRAEAELGAGTTYADDAALAVLGVVVQQAIISEAKESRDIVGAAKGKHSRTLTQVIREVEDSLRIVVLGQWLSEFQSPKAVKAIAQSIVGDNSWRHENKLYNTAAMLVSQVIPQTILHQEGTRKLEEAKGGRVVVQVLRDDGKERRIEIKPPDESAVACIRSIVYDDGGGSQASPLTMVATAMLCCIMAEHPWFQVVKGKSRRTKHVTSYLVLTDEALDELAKDIPKWISTVSQVEPMLVPPVDGGYLSSPGNKVTNKKSIRGFGTVVQGTDHWAALCKSMANTPWTVNLDGANGLSNPTVEERAVVLAYSSLRNKQFYLPIRCDFRGRAYYRTHPVTAQGTDLQKSLLAFTARPKRDYSQQEQAALALHMTNLCGGDMSEASMEQRVSWFRYSRQQSFDNLSLEYNEKHSNGPRQLVAMGALLRTGRWDQIPCQVDGSCNGIQHLSAMFLDEDTGPLVNLVDHTTSMDIYGEVANRLQDTLDKELSASVDGFSSRTQSLIIDRNFVKASVMTLPYGVTRQGVEEQIIKAAAKQVSKDASLAALWLECLMWDNKVWVQDKAAVSEGYLAYADRGGSAISTHPLFRLDCRKLATLLWDTIEEVIPKPMQAMAAFKKIGAAVGNNIFQWRTNTGHNPLWVVQSKSKEASRQLKLRGFHLPGIARSLSLRAKTNEISKGSHTSGIIANFIHSHDADHMAQTCMWLPAGTAFASNHDSYWTRASSMEVLNIAIRRSFLIKYLNPKNHPLNQPCEIINPKTGKLEAKWDSLYDMAEEVGAKFPENGTLDLSEVLTSKWFFS